MNNNSMNNNSMNDIYYENTTKQLFKKLFYDLSNKVSTVNKYKKECTHTSINPNINIKYSCDMCGYGSMLNWIPILKKRGEYGYILLNCNPKSPNYGKVACQKINDETDYEFINIINNI